MDLELSSEIKYQSIHWTHQSINVSQVNLSDTLLVIVLLCYFLLYFGTVCCTCLRATRYPFSHYLILHDLISNFNDRYYLYNASSSVANPFLYLTEYSAHPTPFLYQRFVPYSSLKNVRIFKRKNQRKKKFEFLIFQNIPIFELFRFY